MRLPRFVLSILALLALTAVVRTDAGEKAAEHRNGGVVAVSEPSANVGLAILKQGGSLKKHERFSPQTLHLLTEAMRRSYLDRAKYLGDPAFTKIPEHLTTRDYVNKLTRQGDAHSIWINPNTGGYVGAADKRLSGKAVGY